MFDIINLNTSSEAILMAQQTSINILELQKRFNTEEACHKYLYEHKWPNGFVCPKCGNNKAYEIKTRKHPLYECTQCKHQTTVKVGTIFEKSQKDLVIWFWAIFLMAHDKRGVSALFLSQELHMSYQTAWTMHKKIQTAMGERDAKYTLAGLIELDEAFFGAPTEGGKRGRGTEQTKVLAALSLNNLGHPLFVKFKVVSDLKSSTIVDFAKANFESESTICSDNYKSYCKLAINNFTHIHKLSDHVINPDHLKWLHTIISNAKALIGGTFHGLSAKHLQLFFNEFTYRFNRRKFKSRLFNRLLDCCLIAKPITYPELVG
jgi:transposase-like protein